MSDAETPADTPSQGAGNKTGFILALAGLLVLCAALYWGFLQEPDTPPPAAPQTPLTPEVEVEVEEIVAVPAPPEPNVLEPLAHSGSWLASMMISGGRGIPSEF